jgi:hypothetical protein
MFFLIIFYFLVSTICFWCGLVFFTLIPEESTQKENSNQRPLISYLITGLIVLTAIGEWIALFKPLGFSVLLLILAGFALLTLINKKKVFTKARELWFSDRPNGGLFLISLFCFLIMILVLNAGPTIMDDTDSYHIQMVKWLQEYGTVKGIANLHLRFGFNSSWFSAIGILSPKWTGINSYLSLNGLVSFWLCHYLLEKIFTLIPAHSSPLSKKTLIAYLLLLLFCLVNWPLIRGNAQSANYDFITTCMVIVMFLENGLDSKSPVRLEWLIWPFFLFTVRIINYPLLILVIPQLIKLYKSKKVLSIFFYITIAIFQIAPFLIRNVFLSGYLFFPVYQLDFFSLDWKVNKQSIIEINEYIRYFNRINPGRLPMMVTKQFRFPGWIIQWYKYLFRYDRILIVLSFCAYGLSLMFWKTITKNPLINKFFIGVMVFQLISWFWIAPDPRFVYGPLLFGIFLMPMILMIPSSFNPSLPLRLILSCLAGAVLIYAVSKPLSDKRYRNWLTPADLPVPEIQQIAIGGIKLNIPKKVLNNWNPRCYDIELPCVYSIDPGLRARGASLRDGFKIVNSSIPVPRHGEYEIKW